MVTALCSPTNIIVPFISIIYSISNISCVNFLSADLTEDTTVISTGRYDSVQSLLMFIAGYYEMYSYNGVSCNSL